MITVRRPGFLSRLTNSARQKNNRFQKNNKTNPENPLNDLIRQFIVCQKSACVKSKYFLHGFRCKCCGCLPEQIFRDHPVFLLQTIVYTMIMCFLFYSSAQQAKMCIVFEAKAMCSSYLFMFSYEIHLKVRIKLFLYILILETDFAPNQARADAKQIQ